MQNAQSTIGRSQRLAAVRALFPWMILPILIGIALLGLYGPMRLAPDLSLGVLVATGILWLFAITLARHGAGSVPVAVAGSIALHIVAFVAQPEVPGAVAQRVAEGHVLVSGKSPYGGLYADDAQAGENVRAHGSMSPPLLPLLGAVSVRTGRELSAQFSGTSQGTGEPQARAQAEARWSSAVLRALTALASVLVLWPLMVLLKRSGLPGALCVVWGWCPWVALETAALGQSLGLALALLLTALACFVPKRGQPASVGKRFAGSLALAGALLTAWPVLLALPAILRERRSLFAGIVAILLAACGFGAMAALPGGASNGLQGLWLDATQSQGQNMVFRWLESGASSLLPNASPATPMMLARLTALCLFSVWTVVVLTGERSYGRAIGGLIGGYLILAPVLEPATLAFVVPFVALGASRAWLWLLLCAPLLYLGTVSWGAGVHSAWPSWQGALILVPFLLFFARGTVKSLRVSQF